MTAAEIAKAAEARLLEVLQEAEQLRAIIVAARGATPVAAPTVNPPIWIIPQPVMPPVPFGPDWTYRPTYPIGPLDPWGFGVTISTDIINVCGAPVASNVRRASSGFTRLTTRAKPLLASAMTPREPIARTGTPLRATRGAPDQPAIAGAGHARARR